MQSGQFAGSIFRRRSQFSSSSRASKRVYITMYSPALFAILVAVLVAAQPTLAFNQRGQMPQGLSTVAGIGGIDGTAPPSSRPALVKPRDHWTKRPLPTRKSQTEANPLRNVRLQSMNTDWTTYPSFRPKEKRSARASGTIAIKDIKFEGKPDLKDLFSKFKK